MALREIVLDGDPILKKISRPVVNFDARLHQLLDDMRQTLEQANGYGLAGPQVGVLRRVFITVDERDMPEEVPEDYETKFLEFINPEIISTEGEIRQNEGCLSFPGKIAVIPRPEKVSVRAFDRNGEPFTLEAEGLLARCICHESDHLNGVTIPDRAEEMYYEEAEAQEE